MHSQAAKKLKLMDEKDHFPSSSIKNKEDDVSSEAKNEDHFLLDRKESLDYDTIFNNVSQKVCEIRHANDDIGQLFEKMRERYSEIVDKCEKVEISMKEMEKLRRFEKLTTTTPSEENESMRSYVFSSIAKEYINKTSGPLTSAQLFEFLEDKIITRNKTVLSWIRNYTGDIRQFVAQLQNLRYDIQKSHTEYKEQRKLDVILNKKIDKLIPKILHEFESEVKERKSQTSINEFT